MVLLGRAAMLTTASLLLIVGLSWAADDAIRKTSKDVFERRDESKWIDPQAKFALKDRKKPQSLAGDVAEYDSSRRAECDMDCSRSEVIMLRHVLRNFVSTVEASVSLMFSSWPS